MMSLQYPLNCKLSGIAEALCVIKTLGRIWDMLLISYKQHKGGLSDCCLNAVPPSSGKKDRTQPDEWGSFLFKMKYEATKCQLFLH